MNAAPSRRPRARLATLACLAIAAALGQAPLRAHALGTTRVALSFGEDRTFRVDIETDAAALIEKLERTARRDGQPLQTAVLSERLLRLEAVFRQGFTCPSTASGSHQRLITSSRRRRMPLRQA